MINNIEMIQKINTLAKKQYGDSASTFAWGAAQSFLSAKDLEIILSILREKESETEN